MTTTRNTPKHNLDEWNQDIINALIRMTEDSDGQWVMPWQNLANGNMFAPVNVVTGKFYQGGNILALAVTALRRNYTSALWGTYRQWESKGAQVRKGEKGTLGVNWREVAVKRDEDDDVEADTRKPKTRLVPSFFFLFNAAQVDGYEAPAVELLPEVERVGQVEEFFAQVGAEVRHGGNRAFYSPTSDHIQMPEFGQFVSGVAYYGTLAHEHGHWTGHTSRLARDLNNRFGSQAYAFEELVAEFTAALLLARFGLSTSPREDHAKYLKNWLQVLTEEPKALMTAAKLASQAVTFLVDIRHGDVEDELDKELVTV